MSRRTKPVAWGPSMVPTARRDLTQSLGACRIAGISRPTLDAWIAS